MIFSKIWSLAAMQKILLAMPRSFLKGFHYIEGKWDCTSWEKPTMQLTSEEIIEERDLVLTGPGLLFTGRQKPCWWLTATSKITHTLHSTKPKEHFFFFCTFKTLSKIKTLAGTLYAIWNQHRHHPILSLPPALSCHFEKGWTSQLGAAEAIYTQSSQAMGGKAGSLVGVGEDRRNQAATGSHSTSGSALALVQLPLPQGFRQKGS